MAHVFIGVGSNREREEHIRTGIRALKAEFGNLRISTIYENRAVGFDGADFYNFVVSCETGLKVEEVFDCLRRIEDDYGRDRSGSCFSSITLDLDLLLYDDLVVSHESFELPRSDIDRYAFVLCPLAELAPELRHPVSGKTYARLWSEFDRPGQELRRVGFDPETE
ncbi:MAG: 2-amino-4-hydroxy-6-hydroxymethyldihydropteridine diphosphokinase [Gammaproteobacteria bacterium]|nr:2-amino-4-hydroxy-6-hydroxymethyldihydropteridine diphosphokinase [Gammaproteobacteria bacterium]